MEKVKIQRKKHIKTKDTINLSAEYLPGISSSLVSRGGGRTQKSSSVVDSSAGQEASCRSAASRRSDSSSFSVPEDTMRCRSAAYNGLGLGSIRIGVGLS